MAFVGGVKSVRFNYGDGATAVHASDSGGSPAWSCEDPIGAVKASSDSAPAHDYAQAGTYRVTVTVTTVDCRGFMLPPWEVPGLPMTLPDGTPVAKRMPPVGQDRVTTVGMDIVQPGPLSAATRAGTEPIAAGAGVTPLGGSRHEGQQLVVSGAGRPQGPGAQML